MLVNPNDLTLLVHFDPILAARGDGGHAITTEQFHAAARYCQWAGQHMGSVAVLLPRSCEPPCKPIFANLDGVSVISYSDETGLALPEMSDRQVVWLVNGNRLPIVDWATARSVARRPNCDVLLFGPPRDIAGAHYPESVQVDETGRVLGFRRHYFDSPTSPDRWSGDACFLTVGGRHVRAVVGHVVARGWGLESIGALTRRFCVRWSSEPCMCETDSRPRLAEAVDRGSSRAGTADTRVDGCSWDNPDWALNETADSAIRRGSRHSRISFAFGTGAVTLPELTYGDGRGGQVGVVAAITDPLPSTEPWLRGEYVASEPENGSVDVRSDALYLLVKRLLDICIASAGLLVLSPFLLAVAVLVKCTSRGPILFAHRRQGLNGEEFGCLKFRSMRCDAEAMQERLREFNEVDGPQFKIREDPRLTGLGGWLRRYNIDEIPQLLNVLFGQMSLVGPRPSPDEENQLCPAWRRARLSVRPGITGLWQVLRRRDDPDTDFQEWIYYDVEYVRHRSLWLDWQILIHTPWAMFAPRRLARFIAKLERIGVCCHASRIGDRPAVHVAV